MKIGAVAFVAGVAGFVLGAMGVYTATVAQDTALDNAEVLAHDGEVMDGLVARVAAMEEDVRAQNKRLNGLREDEYQLRDKVREVIERLDALQRRVHAVEQMDRRGAGPTETVDISTSPDSLDKEEFEALRSKVWAGLATPDEEARFWELARTTGMLDGLLKDLEGAVENAPRDVDARMRLASAYVAKLLTVPDGPERGAWAMKAEGQWGKVLEQQPDHWEARYSRAFSWSQWPPFLGKAPAAIKEFETLVDQQRGMTPEPEHAQVYLQLSRLYRDQGNAERATETLRAGTERHPDSQALRDALDTATR